MAMKITYAGTQFGLVDDTASNRDAIERAFAAVFEGRRMTLLLSQARGGSLRLAVGPGIGFAVDEPGPPASPVVY